MTKPAPILIAGPTACGKSEVALVLAERLGGTVINADAMQVYRELRHPDRSSASEEDERRAPHLALWPCTGRRGLLRRPLCRGGSRGNSLRSRHRAGPHRRRRHRALLQGADGRPLARSRRFPTEIRTHWRARAAEEGAKALHERSDRRVTRKWRRGCGRPIRSASYAPSRCWRRRASRSPTGRQKPGEPVVRLEDTTALVAGAATATSSSAAATLRFDRMMAEGAVEEVRALLAPRSLGRDLPVMRAPGRAAASRDACAGEMHARKRRRRQPKPRPAATPNGSSLGCRRNMMSWKWTLQRNKWKVYRPNIDVY